MKSSSLYLCMIISVFALPLGAPAVTLAADAEANDIALDFSLPAGYPLMQNQSMERRIPIEPLGVPTPSRFDLPMLGSALDLSMTPQVGEVHGAEE